MNFKVLSFAVSATAIAATAAYFLTVPPVQSQPRSASERGGEGFGAGYYETTYPYAPETYQYTPSILAPTMRYAPRPVIKNIYIYRRIPCKVRRQLKWRGLPLNH